MLTLGTLATGAFLSTGGSAAKKSAGPPINASSPDEESFIKYVCHDRNHYHGAIVFLPERVLMLHRDFLKSAEGGDQKGNNVDSTKKDAGR